MGVVQVLALCIVGHVLLIASTRASATEQGMPQPITLEVVSNP